MIKIEAISIVTSFIAAGSAVIGVFGCMWRLFKKIDNIQEEFKENTIATLRLTIVNEHLPMDERIHAGEKYIAMGGNGSVKKMVQKLIDEHTEEMLM